MNNEITFKVNDINVLQKFHDFQNSLRNSPLAYKSYIQHILSTSGILLLKKHQRPDLLKFIDSNTANMMNKLGYTVKKFPETHLQNYLKLFNNVSSLNKLQQKRQHNSF